jgi:hypothetical protein
MFLVLASFVCADKVIIFNFNYDNGKITLKEQIIKEGYYPDRKLSSAGDYSCSIVDNRNKNLYSFNFDIPPKLFTDVSQDNSTVGNVVILSKTDFSFVAPYSDNSSKIICYNPNGYEILQEKIQKIELGPEKNNNWIWVYLILALIGLAIIIYLNKRKK